MTHLRPASVSVYAACPPPAPEPTMTTSYSRFAWSARMVGMGRGLAVRWTDFAEDPPVFTAASGRETIARTSGGVVPGREVLENLSSDFGRAVPACVVYQ